MLLGAARYLADTRNFDGTVHFVFQPAEENECGGQAMVEAGLFTCFPVEAVYGMHNWPGVPVGAFAVRSGPIMAADDKFEITISSRGAHAAMPHLGDDPIVAAGALIGAIQTIASRTVDPQEQVVVSLTQLHGGNTWNVIPEDVVLRGTCRYFNSGLRQVLVAGELIPIRVRCCAPGSGCLARLGTGIIPQADVRYGSCCGSDRP